MKRTSIFLSKVSAYGIQSLATFVSAGMVIMMCLSHLTNPSDYKSKIMFALIGFLTNLVSYLIVTKVQKRYVNGLSKEDKQTKETVGWLTIVFATISLYLLATKFGIF